MFFPGVYEHFRHKSGGGGAAKSASPSAAGGGDAHFDMAASHGNVTAYVGQTARLHCVVRNIGDRMVSTFGYDFASPVTIHDQPLAVVKRQCRAAKLALF